MYLFQRLLNAIRGRFKRKPVPNNFSLNVDTLRSLEVIAEREQSTPEEIASQIINHVVHHNQVQQNAWSVWHVLTPREQEVMALICLNYTTRQVASKLYISPETVKTHAEHILKKSGAVDRNALRLMFKDWDFSEWDR